MVNLVWADVFPFGWISLVTLPPDWGMQIAGPGHLRNKAGWTQWSERDNMKVGVPMGLSR
jgi:hypothetical protein